MACFTMNGGTHINSHYVFRLTHVLVQSVYELPGLLGGHAFDVVGVRCYVDVHATAGFVACEHY